MISLTIDDKKVEVEQGVTVLQAAEKLGIHIPTLCHHKSLAPYGACICAWSRSKDPAAQSSRPPVSIPPRKDWLFAPIPNAC